MTIKEVFEKYKHLDRLLIDKEWLPGNWQGRILYDLWQVIRDAQKGNCIWKYDDNIDAWDSDCGECFCITEGTPEENNMRYCHGCGCPIVAVAVDAPVVEGDDDMDAGCVRS